ncbi:AsmA protein [Desulfuromusa kysingii]|uniref:AsmA protein n=1 Tax=Desulfuromusa kysingii TaxID=37625 RepID=A0A1H4BH34_9BACT|nr:DUF748 domain-containing protein [Desulfuromusa kysingii]SEA47364.1 AsmA protein [Desulfuromusa kysingii]
MSTPVKISIYFVVVAAILAVVLTIFVKTHVTADNVRKEFLPLLEKTLDREVDFGAVSIGLFSGISVSDLNVKEKNGKDIFFTVEAVELHYQLLPLLLGNVIIDRVNFDRPVISCSRLDQGDYNFSDLLISKTPRSHINPIIDNINISEILSATFNLLVKEVIVNDGTLLFVDKLKNPVSPFRYTLNHLQIKARQIAFDKPFPVDLSAVLNGSNIDISGHYDLSQQTGDLTVHLAPLDILPFAPYYRDSLPGTLGSANLALKLEADLQPGLIASKGMVALDNVDLIFNSQTHARLKDTQLTVDYALTYDATQELFDLSTLLLSINDINLGAEGKVDLSATDPFLVATLFLKKIDLREVMQSLPADLTRPYQKYSIAGIVDGQIDLSGRLSSGTELLKSARLNLTDVRASAENLRAGVSGDLVYKDRMFQSQNLQLQYGDQQALLQFKFENVQEHHLQGNFTLTAQTLDVNKLLGRSDIVNNSTTRNRDRSRELQRQPSLADDIGPFDFPVDLTGGVAINRLLYNDLPLDKVTATLSLKNNYLTILNLDGLVAGGELKTSSVINLAEQGLTYQGTLAVSQSKIIPLVGGVLPDLQSNISGSLQLHNSFSGRGTLAANVLRYLHLKGSFNLTNGQLSGSSMQDGLAEFLGSTDLKTLNFDSLSGQYEWQDGVSQISTHLDSSRVKISPFGTIGSAGQVDLLVGTNFAPEILAKMNISQNLKHTISDRQGWGRLPLLVQGDLSEPQFGYDSEALQKQIVAINNQQHAEEVRQADQDDKKSVKKMLDNTLNKLFGK